MCNLFGLISYHFHPTGFTSKCHTQRDVSIYDAKRCFLDLLDHLGYQIDNETNIFDEQLESAIKTFQQDNNLKVNGNFDKKTNDKFTEKLVEKANKKDTVLNDLLNKLK